MHLSTLCAVTGMIGHGRRHDAHQHSAAQARRHAHVLLQSCLSRQCSCTEARLLSSCDMQHGKMTNPWHAIGGGCRGRWDVIEAKVAEHKAALQDEMQAWMADTSAGLRAEFEASVQAAVGEALAAQQHEGAASEAQQPELA